MAKQKPPTKKPAAPKSTQDPRIPKLQKRVRELEREAAELRNKAPDQPEPPEYGVLLYLRNASRHWPKKIRLFVHCPRWDKWLYRGGPIPIQQWNKEQEAILDDVASYDHHSQPGILIVELPKAEGPVETPTWEKGLEAARKAKGEKQDEGKAQEPEIDPDERQRPPERSASETLY